ncbi:helicase associated domain-containing protein [Arthrobacter sp. UYCo732]|uniref:helicase associated domain-containing protein n=1 Tax=Arthrobacter sp. UYCo732 TaxID=3156336 RepID=UPI0033996588
MTHNPRSMTWEERCAHLATWVNLNGRTPSQLSEDALERSCYGWLTENRKKLQAGKLTPTQEQLFRALPVSVVSRNTIHDRMDELERFYTANGRLPLTTAVDSEEKSLATFLVANLRAKIKKGGLGAALLKRAEAIPGVVSFALIPDQEQTLHELSEYAARNGHLPPFGVSDNKEEYRLSSWIRNNTRGRPEDKSPTLRARHEAILLLMDRYPAAADMERERAIRRREEWLRDLEAYTEEHQHHPPGTRGEGEHLKRLTAALTAFRKDLGAGKLSVEEEVRVKAILTFPSIQDYEWQSSFEALVEYAASHDGRLPGTWGEGKLFSWLTFQRRQYRKGTLARDRIERLRVIEGALPAGTHAAEAGEL